MSITEKDLAFALIEIKMASLQDYEAAVKKFDMNIGGGKGNMFIAMN